MSPPLPCPKRKIDKIISTQECPQENKLPTWNVKSSFCYPNSPTTKLYETSVQELIGKDKDCVPFYDCANKERYEKLSLPTETAWQGLPLNLSSSSLTRQEENSWFSTTKKLQTPLKNSVKICFQSSTCSPVVHTAKEPTAKRRKVSDVLSETNKVMRVRLVRVKPLQRDNNLNQMFGVYRHLYNCCVKHDNNGEINGATNKTMREWRSKLTKKENWENEKPWIKVLPSLGRQKAIEDFFVAKKENLKRCATKTISKFQMRKKSKYRFRQESVPFENHRIKNNGKLIELGVDRKPLGFRVVGKPGKLFSERNDEKFIRKEVKLIRTKTKKWYIAIPVIKEITKLTNKCGEICALDPGVRTFQTVYGTDGLIAQVGTSFETIEKDLQKADDLISKHCKVPTRQKKKKYKKRYLRIFEKVRNRIRDLHHKVSSWLCRTYRVILLPKFESANMVSKHKLSHKTCRSLLTWSHYKFQTRLKYHAQHYGVKLRIVNEAYTSRTCGRCGKVNDALGANKIFHCTSCNSTMDRDENAARNILLRNLPFIIE